MFVRGVIIHDDVHLQVLRDVLFQSPGENSDFLMPVTRSTFREHFAVRRVQCTPANSFEEVKTYFSSRLVIREP